MMDKRKIVILLISSLGTIVCNMIAPALTGIESSLLENKENSLFLTQLIFVIPALFMAIAAASSSYVYKKVGVKYPLIYALLVYAFVGVLGALVNSAISLLVLRSVFGISAGIIMTSTLSLITAYYYNDERSSILGQQVAFMNIISIPFVIIAGILASFSWRLPFVTYGIAVVFILPAIWFLNEPSDYSDMNMKLKAHTWKLIIGLSCVAFITMMSFFLKLGMLPFMLNSIGISSPLWISVIMAVCLSLSALMALTYRRIKPWFQYFHILIFAISMMALSNILFFMSSSIISIFIASCIFGIGLGFVLPTISDWATNVSQSGNRNVVIGIITMSMFLGQFISVLVVQFVVRRFGIPSIFFITSIVLLSLIFVFMVLSIKDTQNSSF